MSNIFSKIKNNKVFRWSLLIMAIFIIVFVALFVANAYMNDTYKNKFLKGSVLAQIDIGDLTIEEATEKIQEKLGVINKRGFVYNSPNKTVTILPIVQSIESPDTSYSLVIWETEKTLQEIKKTQEGNKLGDLMNKINILREGNNYQLQYSWDRKQHLDILASSFEEELTEKKEANFEFRGSDLEIIPEQIGQAFNYDLALEETAKQISNLDIQDIDLQIIEDKPQFTADILEQDKDDILALKTKGPIKLIHQNNYWNIANVTWLEWLTLKFEDDVQRVGFSAEAIEDYINSGIIGEVINVEVRNAKFNVEDGRVTEFVSSRPGKKANMAKLINDFENILDTDDLMEIVIEVETVEPETSVGDVNDFGIVELLGTGESNFAGSPPNRVHNIYVGADTLNGTLIEPGQEFSLIKALGNIDGESGYKQELVIKGDKTIPEYGGGLCQIGTTFFRGALATGLPITERRNHSYRVSYYEPAGTDATIYSPWPDFKFKNDTEHHVLIQTRIEGVDIYFDFWGTSDGRVASTSDPIIYNIVAPPEKKIIKTTDLEPGQEKCTERAHNGADAKFDYTVTYADERESLEETFYSHYVPWQEVCLLGVTEEELLAEQATSTDSGESTSTEDNTEN